MDGRPDPRYVPDNHSFCCPSLDGPAKSSYGYAFNSSLGGRNAAKMTEFHTTPMVYDSTNSHRNAADPVSSLPSPGRHPNGNNILFLDGNVKRITP